MRNKSFGESKQSILDKIIMFFRLREVRQSVKKNSILVDLGCGYQAKVLIGLIPIFKKGIGIDISVTNKFINHKIQLITHDLNKKLPLKDNSVDTVLSLAVIEHLKNPKILLQESYRILKPGGNLHLTTPSKKAKPILELLAYKLKMISEEEVRDHKRYFDKKSLFNSLIKAGFKEKHIKINYFELGMNISASAFK